MMRNIVLTNDDGIHSPGLKALQEAVTGLGNVLVVAPDRDNSAVSHSITMGRPLKIKKVSENMYSVDGTPTDCVVLATEKILGRRPDLLLSGINNGPNLGDDISYSGTVSASIEATMYNIPSMAISHECRTETDYSASKEIIRQLVNLILANGLPESTLVNLNIPEHPKGFRVTRQGRRLWKDAIKEMVDPFGNPCYWIGGGTPVGDSSEDTDVWAVANGYISVTPIHLDQTNHEGVLLFKKQWEINRLEL